VASAAPVAHEYMYVVPLRLRPRTHFELGPGPEVEEKELTLLAEPSPYCRNCMEQVVSPAVVAFI